MSIFDYFKKNKAAQTLHFAPTQTGRTPFYSDFGGNIYASDIVVQSIRCKANEFKKLRPRHIREKDGQQTAVSDSSIYRVLNRPNDIMTTAEFLEKITILLELNKNVYIYPVYYMTKGGEKVYTGLYPLNPSQVSYMIDAAGKYYIQFVFGDGYTVNIPQNDIIHWRKDYGVNDYFGGGINGGNDNAGLLAALDRYDKLCQSIAKATAVSCQVNGIVKVNTYLNDDKQAAAQAEFEEKLMNNQSGVLFADLKTEYNHIPHDVKLVDSETLKFFYDTILRANGTSLAILNGDYTKAQKEAYYEHAIEPDLISLGQAMTRVLFTDNEKNFGNKVVLYPRNIVFMSMSEKIAALQSGLPAGIFTKNEAREMLGFPPIEGGDVMPRGYNEIDSMDAPAIDETIIEGNDDVIQQGG